MKKVFFALLTVGLAAGLTSCSKDDHFRANFTYEVNGQTVKFINKSENADKYVWWLEKGADNEYIKSTEKNPTHTFQNKGTYQIRLDAIKGNETNSHIDDIIIK